MTYAILRVAAATYADIRKRFTDLDEKLNPRPSYADEYIHQDRGEPERLVFGTLALEAEPAVRTIYDQRTAVDDAQAAARWRALLAAAPRLIGAAGIVVDESGKPGPDSAHNGYMHAGFEFWTQAGPQWIARGKNGEAAKALTAIADQIIAQGGEAWAMEDGKRVEVVTPT